MANLDKDSVVLVTGATGYVGGRLVHRLTDKGIRVRCMVRRPSQLVGRVDADVEIVHGDVSEPLTLEPALRNVHTAYYLVHSLGHSGDFERVELACAENFANAARAAGVQRIVYLGGLGDTRESDSAHMRSRQAVGEILRASGVPTIEFRASIIIGAGSLSFELIRSLVRRLPVMIVPRWVRVKAQPIAIGDVLDYLVQAADRDATESQVFEIGGAEQLSYLDVMKRYAELRGLRRFFINVPVLSPRLSSLWLNLVTPIFARVGRKLIDSVSIASVVRDASALEAFDIRPLNVTDAIQMALDEEDRAFVETHWSDALSSTGSNASYGGQHYGSRIIDSRVVEADATVTQAFEAIERIGGETGWYYANWLWSLRGFLDRMAGGVGMGRGRRNPNHLRQGDVVDCWRVEAIEPDVRLLLRAEMKVFGRAWLQFEVSPTARGTEIRQTAVYDPLGLMGTIYWYALFPLHQFVFFGMLKGIADAAGSSISQPVRSAATTLDLDDKDERRADS